MFLLADDPGVGKTISAVLGARAVVKLRNAKTVLVVADRPASITIGHWCRTIGAVGDGDLTWCVTTWDRLDKVSRDQWDVVIGDEAHMVRRTSTARWKHWVRASGHNKTHQSAPFVILTTATPGQTPLDLPYLVPHFAQEFAEPPKAWDPFPDALEAAGVHLERGRYGPTWSGDRRERAHDLRLVRGWLTGSNPSAMLHRPAPWGDVPINGLPVALSVAEQAQYATDWGDFCTEMQLAKKGRDVARGRAALLRFRQKAGLIRIDATVEWVKQQVEAGRQVAVSVEFVETAADPIRTALVDAGVPVACIYGQGRFDAEAERLRFQTGQARVCVFTVTASISLHASENLSASQKATNATRVGVFHQARYSGIAGRQITGRTHRDHQVSPWHIAYAEGTVEARVAKVMIERIAAASETVGGSTDGIEPIARLLGADWLPAQTLVNG